MKIVLITTLPSLIENKRIEEEVVGLGHKFKLINLKEFSFSVIGGKIKVTGLEAIDADIVIIRGVFNSIKAISTVVNNLKMRGVKVFDNNFLEHRYSIDKVTDLIKLSLANIPIPDMQYVRDFEKYHGAAKKVGYPCVIKSTRMGKGIGIYKIDSKDDLTKFIDKVQNEDKSAKGFIIQKYIPYVFDLRCLIIGTNVFVMQRIPAKGEFRANFSLGGEVKLFDLDKNAQKLAINALRAVDMSIGGVDILITKDNKRYILEVNHTAGFVGMEKATGKNIGKLFVEHAIKNAK